MAVVRSSRWIGQSLCLFRYGKTYTSQKNGFGLLGIYICKYKYVVNTTCEKLQRTAIDKRLYIVGYRGVPMHHGGWCGVFNF